MLPSTPQNLVLFDITVSDNDWLWVPLEEFNLHSYFPVWFAFTFAIDILLYKTNYSIFNIFLKRNIFYNKCLLFWYW